MASYFRRKVGGTLTFMRHYAAHRLIGTAKTPDEALQEFHQLDRERRQLDLQLAEVAKNTLNGLKSEVNDMNSEARQLGMNYDALFGLTQSYSQLCKEWKSSYENIVNNVLVKAVLEITENTKRVTDYLRSKNLS